MVREGRSLTSLSLIVRQHSDELTLTDSRKCTSKCLTIFWKSVFKLQVYSACKIFNILEEGTGNKLRYLTYSAYKPYKMQTVILVKRETLFGWWSWRYPYSLCGVVHVLMLFEENRKSWGKLWTKTAIVIWFSIKSKEWVSSYAARLHSTQMTVVERVVVAAESGKVNAKENRKEKHEHKRHGKTCKNLQQKRKKSDSLNIFIWLLMFLFLYYFL